ncbi:MAG: GDP-mannose 4,6-dehydratase [Candidatus Micrarchaeia archaeon]
MDLSKYNGKIVLVTGGAGFVGTNLCNSLISFGAEVHVIYKKEYANQQTVNINLFTYSLDITNKEKVLDFFKKIKPDIIFHLAADICRDREVINFQNLIDTNVLGLLHLLESLFILEYKVPIIIAGTAEEYGNGKLPFKEEMRENPVSPYSFSKAMATHMAKTFYNIYSFPIAILRATVAYGPGQKGNMFIPSIIQTIAGNNDFEMTQGEQTRDFIFIEDLVQAYLYAGLSMDKIAGKIINIGYGKSYKIKDVAKKIGKLMDKTNSIRYGVKPYRPSEVMDYSVDITRAKKLLGWEPKTDLDNGLKKTIGNFDGHET